MKLVQVVCAVTQGFPQEERYGLVQQMRRSAVSIPSNIAEGAGRTGRREFANFVSIARGSLSELETQMLIAIALGYLEKEETTFSLLEQVSKLLTGLYRPLTTNRDSTHD